MMAPREIIKLTTTRAIAPMHKRRQAEMIPWRRRIRLDAEIPSTQIGPWDWGKGSTANGNLTFSLEPMSSVQLGEGLPDACAPSIR